VPAGRLSLALAAPATIVVSDTAVPTLVGVVPVVLTWKVTEPAFTDEAVAETVPETVTLTACSESTLVFGEPTGSEV
jgi:hypothetical protein